MPHDSFAARRALRAFAVLLVAACGGDPPMKVEDPVPTTLSISATDVQLTYINQSRPLGATVRDQNGAVLTATVDWAIDDPGVATISDTGVLRAVANGSAVVTASIASLTATATVTVAQVASLMEVSSGGGQEAVAGDQLPDPVVVVVWDAGGTPVPGVTVTFAPDAGSVSETSVDTDASGEASTTWTLGAAFGKQRLAVSADVSDVEVIAWSRDVVPTPDLVVSDNVIFFRADPSSLETFEVRNTIKNEGDGESGPFTVKVFADGVEVGAESFGTMARDEQQLAIVTVGPVDAGLRDLTFVIDPDDAVGELIETNNEVGRQLEIKLQTAISTGTYTGLAAAADEDLIFRLDVPAGSPSVLTVSLSGAVGDADLYIERQKRPSARTGYDDCVAAGPTSDERCQVQDPEGAYHIIVSAAQDIPFSDLTLEVTLDDSLLPFELELVFVDSGTPSQNAAFTKAADRWSEVLVGDIPDQVFSTEFPYPAGQLCFGGLPDITQTLDDVRIYVSIQYIDGPLGVLAAAGVCVARHQTELPVIGVMIFDNADLERLELDGDMDEVVLHEMGHVLGIGTIWQPRGLLESPALNNPGVDTHFRGPRTIQAFDDVGGVDYTGSKVPVENSGVGGSTDAHWRESVLDTELMTPGLDQLGDNPLSIVTVQSLADLGYLVDVTAADPYTLPGTAPLALAPERPQIDLSNDVLALPLAIVDERGRIVEIREPADGIRGVRR